MKSMNEKLTFISYDQPIHALSSLFDYSYWFELVLRLGRARHKIGEEEEEEEEE